MEQYVRLIDLERPKLAGELYDISQLHEEARWLVNSRAETKPDKWEKEPDINARTAIFEALTAKGHLSHVEFPGSITEANQRTLQRLINGYSDLMPDWERQRRHLEIVEELTIQRIYEDVRTGHLPPDTIVVTISNFPEGVPENEATIAGYSVLNQKGMVRTTDFASGVRTLEQISRSNSSNGSAEKFLASRGLLVGHGSTRILANQLIATKRDFPDGVVDIQKALDAFSGPNVIYGENLDQPDLNLPDYEALRTTSRAREEQAEKFINKLADFERELNSDYQVGNINYEQKIAALYQRRKELIAEICLLAPQYAKDAMGTAAAEYMEKASFEMAAGNDTAGMQYMENALAAADPRAGAVCGGNGRETVIESSKNQTNVAWRLYSEAKDERKYWKWSRGTCVVQECPTRPAKTEVGPCSVCRKCQSIFDSGKNPKSIYKTRGVIDIFFESISESNRQYKIREEIKKAAKQKKAA